MNGASCCGYLNECRARASSEVSVFPQEVSHNYKCIEDYLRAGILDTNNDLVTKRWQ
jgi:hypothetical protein